MNTYVHLLQYVDEFFSERDLSDISCRENKNRHVMFNNFF
jgi:hypothetical protein